MPTYSELTAVVGFRSKNAAYKLVTRLIDQGLVEKDAAGKLLPGPHFHTVPVLGTVTAGFPSPAEEELGVSHLLHTKRPSHLRAFLDKLGNVEGEVLDRLIDLNIVLPGYGRPDAVVVFLQPSQQPHPGLRVGATPVRAQALFPPIP